MFSLSHGMSLCPQATLPFATVPPPPAQPLPLASTPAFSPQPSTLCSVLPKAGGDSRSPEGSLGISRVSKEEQGPGTSL